MADGTTKTMPGDTEAAAAIAGMIETYGTPAEAGTRVFTVSLSERYERGKGFSYWISEYECVGRLPGGIGVLRTVFAGRVNGAPFFYPDMDGTYDSREAALLSVAEKLLDVREVLTAQIDRIKAEVLEITSGASSEEQQ